MIHEQAYRAGQQDCRDGVPVEQGLEDFMRDAVTQTGEDREDIHELANAIVVAWENSSHQFPLTYQHQLQMALIASRFLVRLSHSTPGDAEVRELLTRFVAWVARVDALDDDLRYLNGQHPDQMAAERDGWDDLRDIAADALPVIATPSGRAQGEVKMQHVAYFDEGEFHWMSGIKPRDCELYAAPPAQDQGEGHE